MILSIVIPTHNRTGCLSRCLAALECAQTASPSFEPEVVVVDDGSAQSVKHRNRALCDRYGAVYRPLERNRGMAVARAEGVSASCGEWIAFLDDDVLVERHWLERLGHELAVCTAGVVGLEGRVEASGDGVWDAEVRNPAGGLYLTCHIVYRRRALEVAGGFDTRFEREGPFHEDHELAARMLQCGDVSFCRELRAVHLPRRVRLGAYLVNAPRRIRQLLDAELYFYLKQRDRYHLFRHEKSFWRTYGAIATRHLYTTLHRRSIGRLIRHPLQTLVLAAATTVEQLCALALFPRLLWRFVNDTPGALVPWVAGAGGKGGRCAVTHLDRTLFDLARFAVSGRPVYDAVPALLKSRRRDGGDTPGRLFLRVDDVFVAEENALEPFLAVMERLGVPFLAAITGDDLRRKGAVALVRRIEAAGGVVGLHGFTHRGRFGPFASEILQMTLPELAHRLDELRKHRSWKVAAPMAFIPPFNAINALQIRFLAHRFAVIGGGPETARFTDRILGPVVIEGGGVYFPSFYPFYGTSAAIRKGIAERLDRVTGQVCMTVHMGDERADGYAGLTALIEAAAPRLASWESVKGMCS